jgi:hypothetical protein
MDRPRKSYRDHPREISHHRDHHQNYRDIPRTDRARAAEREKYEPQSKKQRSEPRDKNEGSDSARYNSNNSSNNRYYHQRDRTHKESFGNSYAQSSYSSKSDREINDDLRSRLQKHRR